MRQADPRLRNGKAVGPTDLQNPGGSPTDDFTIGGADSAEIAAHRAVVTAEIKAVEVRVAEITARLSVTPESVISEEKQEAERERRLLRELVEDLRADVEPATEFPSGARVDDRMRRSIAAQAAAFAENKFEEANRLASRGDWRAATRARVDAYRARLVVEFNDGLRKQLRGYGMMAWY